MIDLIHKNRINKCFNGGCVLTEHKITCYSKMMPHNMSIKRGHKNKTIIIIIIKIGRITVEQTETNADRRF